MHPYTNYVFLSKTPNTGRPVVDGDLTARDGQQANTIVLALKFANPFFS